MGTRHDGATRTGQLRRLDDIETVGTASVLVDHYDDDWSRLWWVRIRGLAVVHREHDDAAQVVLGALAAKYPQYRERPPAGTPNAARSRRDRMAWTCASRVGGARDLSIPGPQRKLD